MNDAAGERRFDRPEDDVKLYVAIAKLPEMTLGETAPPVHPPQHKAHLNHLHVQPESYRKRLAALISCRDAHEYDQLVRTFTERLPTFPLNVPARDERTGAAFTIPVRGLNLNIDDAFLPRPTTLDEIIPWLYAYPFQTLIRVMQVTFPATAGDWSITPSPYQDIDRLIWQTYIWRRSPPPSDLETYYRYPRNPVPEASMIICVQPPWIISEADVDSFKRATEFPTFVENGENRPYKSAHRIWAKLWDLCAKTKCRFWVLTSYQRWIFGSFSRSFKAGHIFAVKPFNAHYPSIMQTLVFHTAKSMGLADDLYLPEYFDSTDDYDDPPDDLPQPPNYPDMDFPNSESEWEGMEEDPGISAGVSDYLDARLSAYGSAANVELPVVRVFRNNNANRRPPRAPPRRRRPTPPEAGPSWAGPSLLRARRRSSTASSRSTASPRLSDTEDSDVESNAPAAPPVPPARGEYWGISRAPAEVTENIVTWSDNVDTDAEVVEELLRVNEEEEENPNPITHNLPIERLYHAALQTVDPNGGASLSLPRSPRVTIHQHRPYDGGGYMHVIPELGTIREIEETQALDEQLRRDLAVQARWREYETVGVPVEEGPGANDDPLSGPPASRA